MAADRDSLRARRSAAKVRVRCFPRLQTARTGGRARADSGFSYSEIYRALVPGEQSATCAIQPVSDTGAPSLAGGVFDFAVGAMVARELSGYVATPSPRRALQLADRLGASAVWDVTADVGSLAVRVSSHAAAIGRRTARAGDPEGGCRRQVLTYLNERHLLTGRAREVRQSPRGRFEKAGPVQPFDEALFVRGLTPAGRAARDELIAAGNGSPSPADVFRKTLVNLGRR